MAASLLVLVLVLVHAGCAGSRDVAVAAPEVASPTGFTADDYAAWKQARPWTSREELFQLFSHLIAQEPQRTVRVERETLARIAPQMASLFPLAACEEIDYREGRLRVRFAADQTVSVPRAFGQAALAMSRELVFAVVPLADATPGSLAFTLQEGWLRVEFSWLAKLMGPVYVRDFPIVRLDYRLDADQRASSLTAGNEAAIPRTKLAISSEADAVTVDLLDAGHPRDRDLVITRQGIDFRCLGWKATLNRDRVEINGDAVDKPQLRAALAWVAEQAFSDLEGLFANGFHLDERYRYDLEARAIMGMNFTWDFKPARD